MARPVVLVRSAEVGQRRTDGRRNRIRGASVPGQLRQYDAQLRTQTEDKIYGFLNCNASEQSKASARLALGRFFGFISVG